jgi:polar amino acid transport system permease protein
VTIGAVGALVGVLALAAYDFDFRPVWRYRNQFINGLLTTLGATGLAYILGLVLGVLVAIARMSRSIVFRHLGDLYVEVIRGTPFIVQVSIAWFGIASQVRGIESRFLVGTLALGVFAAAYMGEILRAGVESIDRGQVEAARSLGLSRRRTLRHVIFPQALKRMIPPLTGELIALTKESSLLFTIGVMEVMAVGRQMGSDTYRPFEGLLVVALLYLVLTIPLSLLARRLERRLGRADRVGVHL